MSTPFADLQDSLLLWASQTELDIAGRLSGAEWFTDTALTADELESIDRFYGTFLARQISAGAELPDLLEITPALATATLVSHASVNTDPARFFTDHLVGLGLEARAEWAELLEGQVPVLLGRVGLTVLDAPAVDLLAVHAGLPWAEVGTLLELLDRTGGGDVAALLLDGSWAWPDMEDETLDITAAVAELAPGRFAALLDGINELRAFALEHPTSWPDRVLPDSLPALVAEPVIAELRERPVGMLDRASAVGVATRELRPRLIFDARRAKVCLRLPQQRVRDELGEVSWRVNVEGTTRIFRTGRPWGEPTWSEALDITVERQIREATVQDVSNGITWTTPVVETADPVLIFAANGQNLTAVSTLHHREVWVLVPADATITDTAAGQELPVLEELEVEGWTSWIARRLDLTEAASLQVTRDSQTSRLRSVDPRQRVTFLHPSEPLEDVRSLSGLPVYPGELIADFPPTPSGRDETWQLSISAYARPGAAGDEIAPPEPLEIQAGGGQFAIFDPEDYDSPWVGEYLVRVRGPRGESFRHRYTIVEGMVARTIIDNDRSVRIPAVSGLSDAQLYINHGDKPFAVDPRRVTVDAHSAGADFAVETDEGDRLPLRFVPPRMAFELPVREGTMWRTTRLICTPRDLDPAGELRVRVGGEMGRPQVRVLNNHGTPVRTVPLKQTDPLTYSAPFRALATSAATLPSGRVELEWVDSRADERTSVTLAELSTPHCAGVTVQDGALVFEDLAQRSLGAWVWPLTAPWAPAVTLPEVEKSTPLPESLIDAGPLAVILHSVDPFTTLRAPQYPGERALTAEQPGYYTAQNNGLESLSAFLAGEREEAPTDPEIMPILWELLAETDDPRSRSAVSATFASAPSAAIAALADSLVPAGLQPGRVIASGLATVASGPGEPGRDTGHRAAWLGALELLAEIAATEESDRVAQRELRNRLADVAGRGILNTLDTGHDSSLDSACIDQSTVLIAKMDAAQQEALLAHFFSSAELVPGALSDDNARLLAVFETFRRREELIDLLTSEDLIKPAVSLLRGLRSANRALYSNARVRFDKLDGVNTDERANAWALAPVVSLVFALAARMHAHGLMGKSKTLEAASRGWSRMADIVPDLVSGDLVSAEAMVLATQRGA
ncbi:hypothetical protein [Corynebacterium marinum]|uniref:Uncharacterized protein n=1 Tax=Corynebacterium marinum DSM 44953 TaxID=1224162 RepID=A0A0B6TGT7_9CORY|nr:hypothetical protein [Corynebacterium marinum]AJK69192.1 hypothetical protein B840_07970 [Corynebacterium marinum DSM 44953]GGO17233.1 hypothetical protein GCM10010980_14270 [Corynebacterium marinum]